MPNAAIPRSVRDEIQSTAIRLAERVVAYSLLNFPMTVDQIEAAINDPDDLPKMQHLQVRGIEMPRTNGTNLLLDRRVIPTMRRSVVVGIMDLPRQILVPRTGVHGSVYNARWENPDPKHRDYHIPNLEGYTDEDLEALGTWANHAVRNTRMRNLVTNIVTSTLNEKRTRTVGHLHAWWPALCGIYNSEPYWITRLRNPPTRNHKIYAPCNLASHMNEAKLRKAAEEVFVKAGTLPPYKQPPKARAVIQSIECLQGDEYIC